MEYIVILLYSLLLATKWQRQPSFVRFKTAYFILFLVCVSLFSLRYRVGIDTLNYMYSYDEKPTLAKLTLEHTLASTEAPFYTLLNSFCRSVSSSFYLLQFAVSFIFNSCLFVFIKRYAQNPFLGFAVFFYMNGLYFNTEIMKESLAVGFFLLNTENLLKRRWKRYYLLAFVSLMFHYSAVVIFVFPLFSHLRFNWVFYSLLAIFFIGSKILADLLISMISFAPAAFLIDRYTNMMEADWLNLNWIIFAFLQIVLIPFCMLSISKYGKWKLGKFECLICLCVLLGAGCVYFEIVFQRFTNYVAVIYAICLSNLLSSNEVKKICKVFIITSFSAIYTFSYISHNRYFQWFPYHSIFNEQKVPEREDLWFETFGGRIAKTDSKNVLNNFSYAECFSVNVHL